nr:hypothetical protein [Tanacetum cinerariifolium]
MTTLAEFMIIAGADNHPPMLEKYLYDSWKSHMELYIENQENGRMILNSVQNSLLVWPTIVEEDGATRKKKYEELSVAEKLEADCEGHMARKCTQPKRTRNAAWFKEKAMLAEAQESDQILDDEQLAFLADPGILDGQTTQTTIPNTIAFQTKDLNAYDSNCDDVSNAKVMLMANLSNYGSVVILEVPHFEPHHTDMDNQSVNAMQGFKQTPVVNFTDYEITSDNNIILVKEYQERDKIGSKPDKNGKCGEAGKCQKQL